MLSFTAPAKEEAQQVLAGYIQFISEIVVQDSLENIRNQLEVKTRFEKERLALERVKLKNQLDTNIQRLNYSLEIANAAGIKKPVYSNGQAVKDDPDFSISLGADGIQRKLEIEKSVTDVAELNAELKNRQYYVEQLESVNVQDVKFSPFKYQLKPSLPVKKQGPGRMIVVVLAALLGGLWPAVAYFSSMQWYRVNGMTPRSTNVWSDCRPEGSAPSGQRLTAAQWHHQRCARNRVVDNHATQPIDFLN